MSLYQKLLNAGFSREGFENFVSDMVIKTSLDEPIQHITNGLCSWENCVVGLYIKTLGITVDYSVTPMEDFLTENLGYELSEFVCLTNENDTYGDLLDLINRLY